MTGYLILEFTNLENSASSGQGLQKMPTLVEVFKPFRGWRKSSVTKVLITKAGGPGFSPQNPHQKAT